ncbi:MAG: GNVR domain-containing protein [Planctomycetota bacterium]
MQKPSTAGNSPSLSRFNTRYAATQKVATNIDEATMDNYSILDALRSLQANFKRVAIWTAIITVVVVVITLAMPKTYTSQGRVFVRLGRENASLDATTTLGEHPVVAMPLNRESEINSVTEMIRSRSLFEQVVDEVGAEVILDKAPFVNEAGESSGGSGGGGISLSFVVDPLMAVLTAVGAVDDVPQRERAVIRLSKDVEVEPLEKSNVIQIEYDCHDPALAQYVVQLLIQKYMESHASIHRSSDAYGFLETQTERVRIELTEVEDEFEQFKNQSGILEIGQEREAIIDRIATIRNKKLDNDAQLAGVEQSIEQLQASLDITPEIIIVESTKGVGQEGVDGMRETFFQLELRHSQLVAQYSEAHPQVISIKEQLDDAREIIEAAERTRGEEVLGFNRVYGEIQIELIKQQAQRATLLRKSDAFDQQLTTLADELHRFNSDETRFVRLQRQCAIGDASYRKFANNLEQARIDEQLQSSNMSNISIAQQATFSQKPSKPSKLLNLFLGLVFGTMTGVGLNVLKDIRRLDDESTAGRTSIDPDYSDDSYSDDNFAGDGYVEEDYADDFNEQ